MVSSTIMLIPNITETDPTAKFIPSPYLLKAFKSLDTWLPSAEEYTAFEISTAMGLLLNRNNGWRKKPSDPMNYNIACTLLQQAFGCKDIHPNLLLERLRTHLQPSKHNPDSPIPSFKLTQILKLPNQTPMTMTFPVEETIKAMKRTKRETTKPRATKVRKKAPEGATTAPSEEDDPMGKEVTPSPKMMSTFDPSRKPITRGRPRSSLTPSLCLNCNNTSWKIRADLGPNRLECTRCRAIVNT